MVFGFVTKLKIKSKEKSKSKDGGTGTPASPTTPVSPGDGTTKTKTKEKKKKLGYQERMMVKYKLTKDQYKGARKDAEDQKANWIKYKREQVVAIFGSKSKYVSKSAASDVLHPSSTRGSYVVMLVKEGREVNIEFGKRLEHLLDTSRPDPRFVIVKPQINKEKTNLKTTMKFRMKHKLGGQMSKDKKMAYDRMKSVNGEGGGGGASTNASTNANQTDMSKIEMSEKNVDSQKNDDDDDDDFKNTTDTQHKVFPKEWFSQSVSAGLVKSKKGQTFWMPDEEDNQGSEVDEDENKKYAVTADVVMEVLEKKKEVEKANIKQPTDKSFAYGDIAEIYKEYEKCRDPSVVFANTVRGTIDFDARAKGGASKEKSEIGKTDKVKWPEDAEVIVFKGKWLKRNPTREPTKTEKLEDIVRKEEEE